MYLLKSCENHLEDAWINDEMSSNVGKQSLSTNSFYKTRVLPELSVHNSEEFKFVLIISIVD